jgi:hypothetical protein
MEALQILKFTFKKQRLDFTIEPLAEEKDYSIEGPLTTFAFDELVANGHYNILGELWVNEADFYNAMPTIYT